MSQILSEQVFTADELARAAGVGLHEVETRLATGEIRTVPGTLFITSAEAVCAGRLLRAAAAPRPAAPIAVFADRAGTRATALPRRGGVGGGGFCALRGS